jgi:hypothetical protein
LHSRTLPIELLANPDPANMTAWPLVNPVDGVAVIVAAAKAEIVVPRRTEPATTRTEAATIRIFARASRVASSTVTSIVRSNHFFTADPPPIDRFR